MVVNNHGILLPSTCSEGEVNHLKKIQILMSKF